MITAAPKISFKEIILNQRCLSDLIGSVLTSHTFTLNLQNLKKKIYRIRISEDRTWKYVFLKNVP